MEPQDRLLSFGVFKGMFKGQASSFVPLNHFGYPCWATSQKNPSPIHQGFIDYGDVLLFEKSVK
eukprot:4484083-Alexandrium_andersonii.AAC.1